MIKAIKLIKKQRTDVLIIIISLAIYISSAFHLGGNIDLFFLLILAAPCVLYKLYAAKEDTLNADIDRRILWGLVLYALIYFTAMYHFTIIGSSLFLWLFQFVIPVVFLKINKTGLASFNFEWKKMFGNFKLVIAAGFIVLPFLVFNIRDSKEILEIFRTSKIVAYLPLSIIYMLIIVAFWEEFFFRGILLTSFGKLLQNESWGIFTSSLLFAVYHIPMRFMNPRSPCNGHLLMSIAATIQEQFIMGLFLGYVAVKSKNIWHAIWLHAMFNGISYVYQITHIIKF